MTAWDELREALSRLRAGQPGALRGYPDFDRGEAGPPPYQIWLAPWALDVAERLHRQFGDQVDLTVGALGYPPGRPSRWPPGLPGDPAQLLAPDEAEAELDGPAVVRSGHTLDHGLLIRDRSGAGLAVATNGRVTAVVVDPATGEVVGGFAGFQTLPGVVFRVPPGGTERIPLLIGTASVTERLGYAVPPGRWGIQVALSLIPAGEPPFVGERTWRRTPVLPLEITA
jgi:hypothetical protein